MRRSCVIALAVLTLLLCSQGHGQWVVTPDKCCFRYFTKKIPPRAITRYKVTSPSCPRDGVLLVTVKGKELCADPKLKEVQDIMDRVDNLFGTT